MVLDNVRASQVVRARRLLQRDLRIEDGLFLAEGPQAVREAVVIGRVQDLFITQEAFDRYDDIVSAANSAGVDPVICSEKVISQFSSTVNPQGMTAVVESWTDELADVITKDTKLAVAMTAVRDPGNAGSVIRVADAAGATGVVFSKDSVDLFNPKVVRATVGSLFHLPVATGYELSEIIAQAKACGLQVLAADGTGVNLYQDVELSKPTLWVFGNEAWGIPSEVLDQVDQVVAIPIYGQAESLNLATASAVCLYASATSQGSGLQGK